MEVFMDVPIDVVQERDPKGLYAKVAAGEIKQLRAQCAEPWKEARCRRETPCNSRAFLSVVFSFLSAFTSLIL